MSSAEEKAIVLAFVDRPKAQRLLALLSSPKGRRKLRAQLAHFAALDPRFASKISARDHHAGAIEQLLRAKGAPDTCSLISEDLSLDGKRMNLRDALVRIVGRGMGTIVSCIPGKLGYFESEDVGERYILERKSV